MELIYTYLKYLKNTKRYSLKTIESYRVDLKQFNQFIEKTVCINGITNVNYHHIRDWVIKLVEDKISARSINRKITSLKSFYKFLLQQQKIVNNPAAKIESLKMEKKLPTFIKREQIEFLFDELDFGTGFENLRNKIILELLYLTGIRLSELTNLRDSDIDIGNSTIKVIGKRNKERIIPVSINFINKLNQYIKIKNRNYSNQYLFLTNRGEQIYPKLVYRLVNKYLSFVSTQKKKSPHILRHTFATHLLNNGADLNAIKEILGHASLAATEVYTHVSFEKLKSIYKHAHPRALIMED